MRDPVIRQSIRAGAFARATGRADVVNRAARKQGNRRPLVRRDLPVDTETLARYLVGKQVVRELPEGMVSGRIVETEAYVIGDEAGHGFRGMTPRNRALFLQRGHAYVYLAYGVSWMLNVSSETAGTGAGVLIRALEPLVGVPIMEHNRGTTCIRDLARGPGRLAQALRIDRALDGFDLCRKGSLWLAPGGDIEAREIGQSIRIGITRDVERPLRFFLRGSPFASGPRSGI